MAYEPTIWKTGDIVSSERMNKIEQAIASNGGNIFYCNASIEDYYDEHSGQTMPVYQLDHTTQELIDVFDEGKIVVVTMPTSSKFSNVTLFELTLWQSSYVFHGANSYVAFIGFGLDKCPITEGIHF